MGSFSIWHWLIVLLIVALLFGTKKLRNIGGDLGGAVKDFKKGLASDDDEPGKLEKGDKPEDSAAQKREDTKSSDQ